MQNKIFYLLFLIFILSCTNNDKIENNKSEFEFIKSLHLIETNHKLILSYNNINQQVSLDKSILPLKTCIVTNSSTIGYMNELNLLDYVIGISDPKTIYNNKIHKNINNNKIKIIGSYNIWDIEKIVSLNPSCVFTLFDPNFLTQYKKLNELKIPIIFIQEFEEQHPLGRTEYLKLFGKLFKKENLAQSKYNEIKKLYNSYKKITYNKLNKPKIMAKIMYGDIWYLPSGNSYNAILYKDAGGDYLWDEFNKSYSLSLSFEEVYAKAKNADIWIDASNFKSLKELKSQNINYQYFKPYKTKQVYSITKRENKFGANDYFETGVVRSDLVLIDLINIFYNKKINEYNFYKNL